MSPTNSVHRQSDHSVVHRRRNPLSSLLTQQSIRQMFEICFFSRDIREIALPMHLVREDHLFSLFVSIASVTRLCSSLHSRAEFFFRLRSRVCPCRTLTDRPYVPRMKGVATDRPVKGDTLCDPPGPQFIM